MAVPRIVVLLAALAQVPAATFSAWSGIGEPIGARSDAAATPIVPADYAFAIWGPIFALSIAHAAAAFRPRWRDDPAFARLSAPAGLGAVLNCVWMVWAQATPFTWPLFPLIVGILAAAIWGLLRAAAMPATGPIRLARLYFGLFAGWVTAATFVAIRATLPDLGPLLPEPAATLVPLAGSFALATAMVWRTGSVSYAAAVVWALIAIAVANGAAKPWISVVAVGLAFTLAVAAAAARPAAQPAPR
jgi:hypothetical protein